MRSALERHAALIVLGVGGVLVAVCVLFSDGSSNGRLVWIGLVAWALAALAGCLAWLGYPRPALAREAWIALGLLAAFVVWCGLSVLWSMEPDRSWDYLNRGLVYLALAVVGLALGALPGAVRLWAYVLAAIVALALGWTLLGKAVPAFGGSGRIARLSAPVGYWNALALLLVLGLPLALWLAARREHSHWLRAGGAVFLYGLVVGLLLTYSRGGVAVALVAIAAWLVLGGPRLEGAAALLLGGGAGVAVAVWAFSRPGLADDLQPHSSRVHDGAWFALVFVLGAAVVAALAYLGSLAEEQRPLDEARRRAVGRIALAALAVGAAAAIVGLVVESKPQGWFREFSQAPTNTSQIVGPTRLTTISSTSRWQWWTEAWTAFTDQPVRGTGAGSFELAHRLLRSNNIVVTEPHNVPLQFLAETGVIGFLLALGSVAAAGLGVLQRVRGLGREEQAAAFALVVAAGAYLLHSVVDFDWDFVAVSAPFFVTVGVLLGGGPVPGERRVGLAPLPAVVALAVALSLLTPWFAQRDTDSALAALDEGRPALAASRARDAHSLNPLSQDPLLVQAGALEQLGLFTRARELYVRAVELQPLNWRGWYELGRFEAGIGNYGAAVGPLRRAVFLDRYGSLAPPLLVQVEQQAGSG
jgi:O-Antigen ligase